MISNQYSYFKRIDKEESEEYTLEVKLISDLYALEYRIDSNLPISE